MPDEWRKTVLVMCRFVTTDKVDEPYDEDLGKSR